jgi:hypothetical protein
VGIRALLAIGVWSAAAAAVAAAAALWLIVARPLVLAQAIEERSAAMVVQELTGAAVSALRALLNL